MNQFASAVVTLAVVFGYACVPSLGQEQSSATDVVRKTLEVLKKKVTPSNYEHLKNLDARIGEWEGEVEVFSEGKPVTKGTFESVAMWSMNKNFQEARSKANIVGATMENSSVIGWDPATKQVRQWTRNSFGTFGELTQVAFDPDGEDVWEGTVVTPDGKKHPTREVYTTSGETVVGKNYTDGKLAYIIRFHQKDK